jgi:DNA-binding NtrC family response regulator
MKKVLIIDDELAMPGNSVVFSREYEVPGFSFDFCGSLEEAVRLGYWDYSLVLLDIRFEGLGDDHGIELLDRIRERAPHLPVVMLSSRTTPEILIRCWDKGAQAYIVKWTSNPRFHTDLKEKIERYARALPKEPLIGESAAMRSLKQTIETLAGYDISVLITGETGSGKELVARALHEQGKRRDKPFVAINAGAIPATLIESELFGHVKGAFTGATDRKGKVESANGGTLFLDEVADLPLELQVKLLRLLDAGEFMPVGSDTPSHADIRIIAATNKDLEGLVRRGGFREDLFFRLNGFKIQLPSLTERKEDIPLLAEHFLELFKNMHPDKSHIGSFAPASMRALQQYKWPGNVRELRNTVERAAILTAGDTIEVASLPLDISSESEKSSPASASTILSPGILSEDKSAWPRERLLAEIKMALQVKQYVQGYKGKQWKAEFMRLMYPECKAASAKGFDDLIRRLTQGPWGDPKWEDMSELKKHIEELDL